MAIDLAAADIYFDVGNHVRAPVWAGFSKDQRGAALLQALRLIARMLDDEPEEPSDPNDVSAFPREDFAVYEQALWLLENSATVANGDGTAPRQIATDPEQTNNTRQAQKQMIAPEAMRWLLRGGQVCLSRG